MCAWLCFCEAMQSIFGVFRFGLWFGFKQLNSECGCVELILEFEELLLFLCELSIEFCELNFRLVERLLQQSFLVFVLCDSSGEFFGIRFSLEKLGNARVERCIRWFEVRNLRADGVEFDMLMFINTIEFRFRWFEVLQCGWEFRFECLWKCEYFREFLL